MLHEVMHVVDRLAATPRGSRLTRSELEREAQAIVVAKIRVDLEPASATGPAVDDERVAL
jgi:hypothetical protein